MLSALRARWHAETQAADEEYSNCPNIIFQSRKEDIMSAINETAMILADQLKNTRRLLRGVYVERNNLNKILKDVQAENAELATLVKNQTIGGEAQRGIITSLKSRLDTREKETEGLRAGSAVLRSRLDTAITLADDRQDEVDTRENHVRDLIHRLTASNRIAATWQEQVNDLEETNKALQVTIEVADVRSGDRNSELEARESHIRDLVHALELLQSKLDTAQELLLAHEEMAREKNRVISLNNVRANTSYDTLQDDLDALQLQLDEALREKRIIIELSNNSLSKLLEIGEVLQR